MFFVDMPRISEKLTLFLLFSCMNWTSCFASEICPENEPFCYIVVNESKSWIDAEQHCVDQGAELAVYQDVPSTILETSGINSFWLRRTHQSAQSSAQLRWLDGTEISWINDIVDTSPEMARHCLGIEYRNTGQRWFSSDCEAQHHFLCETEHGRECRLTGKGSKYRGTVAYSRLNETCERWDSKTSTLVPDHFSFPDGNKTNAKNYCRNPNSVDGGLWCFIENRNIAFRNCKISGCAPVNNSCFESQDGTFPEKSVHCTAGKCYISLRKKVSWLDAQACCNSMSANLATFDHQALVDDVYSGLTYFFAIERISSMWVGGYSKVWDSVMVTSGNYIVQCFAWSRETQPVFIVAPCNDMKSFVCAKSKVTMTTTTTTTTPSSTTPSAVSHSLSPSSNDSSSTAKRSFPASDSPVDMIESTVASNSADGNTVLPDETTLTTENKYTEEEDNMSYIFIGIGAGAGLLVLIVIISAISCAFCPKNRKKPFSLYSQEITPYANDHTRETYYNNSVFEDNELYDNSENIPSQHYDVPPGAKPIYDNHKPVHKERHEEGARRSSSRTNNTGGIANPLYNDERGSIYSQPSKKVKPKSIKATKKREEESVPNYSELPELPPRVYAEHETQTSTYYNY